MLSRRALLIVAVLWLASISTAQSQTSRYDPVDLHTRLGAGVTFDMPNRWKAALEYEARLVDNASIYRGSYVTGEVGKGLARNLSVFGNYRLAMMDVGTSHRFAAGAQARTDLGNARVSFRPMVQYRRQSFSELERSDGEDTFVRTRLRVKYPLAGRVDAYASTEPFFTLAEGAYPIDNVRNTLGVQIEYRKKQTLDLYYIYRPDYAKSYNRTFHTVGVSVDFERDLLKRKRRK